MSLFSIPDQNGIAISGNRAILLRLQQNPDLCKDNRAGQCYV